MPEFTEHNGGESPISSNLDFATIEVETRGGLTLKHAGNRIAWQHSGKIDDVMRWRVVYPVPKPPQAQ